MTSTHSSGATPNDDSHGKQASTSTGPEANALWTEPRQMYPILPTLSPIWAKQSADLGVQATRLETMMPLPTRAALSSLLRVTNCFYSNLIEGHRTYPGDIDLAMRKAKQPDRPKETRTLVEEALAHIQVQEEIDAHRVHGEDRDPTAKETLCWIHHGFINRLPDDLRWAKGSQRKQRVLPGRLRTEHVAVGRHDPPAATHLDGFLDRFHIEYRDHTAPTAEGIARVAAAHHRILWIHPFLDGNGRVARLMTDWMLSRCGLDAGGIWRISRGFAHTLSTYRSLLEEADQQRRNDLDGRGNLTQRGLDAWCDYVVATAADQMSFVQGCLQDSSKTSLLDRLHSWVKRTLPTSTKPFQVALLLERTIRLGEVRRVTGLEILGGHPRHGRRILDLLAAMRVMSVHDDRLLPAIPISLAPVIFPALFPHDVEEGLTAAGQPWDLAP